MRSLEAQLSNYAAYHRCRRNLVTHFLGIPLIVLGVATLLARPAQAWGPIVVSPAAVVTAAVIAFYCALDLRFGLVLTVWMGTSLWFATRIAAAGTAVWLFTGGTLFILGWGVQLAGHGMEGRKPAFVDDLLGLLIGPLFLVAELGFALGLRRDLRRVIESEAGPMRH